MKELTESKEMLDVAVRTGAVKIMIPVTELEFMLQQASKIEEMQKTLEWYADENNYEMVETPTDEYSSETTSEAWKDSGERARQALKGGETK